MTDEQANEQQKPSGIGGLLRQMVTYGGVSFTQTFVEFGAFALLQAVGLGAQMANGLAIVVSASYNFVMNRNVTFKASSNFARSVALFVLLYLWNFAFSAAMLAWLPGSFGWDPTVVKLFTMCCQGVWGFVLCRNVIFR